MSFNCGDTTSVTTRFFNSAVPATRVFRDELPTRITYRPGSITHDEECSSKDDISVVSNEMVRVWLAPGLRVPVLANPPSSWYGLSRPCWGAEK